jgi:RNA-directed DNA polymerase
VKVHYGEGVATHTGPESCALRREASREALTGVCVGQVVSGESNVVRGANAVVAAEGNRGGCDSARIRTTPRRLGPWHAHTPPAREPGELRHRLRRRSRGRNGKTGGHSRR